MDIYRKSFIYSADRYEVWERGQKTQSGACATKIMASSSDDKITFTLSDCASIPIAQRFSLYYKSPESEILADRIQYGDLMDVEGSTPGVCNIFTENNNIKCLRFMNYHGIQFQLIEFYGTLVNESPQESIALKTTACKVIEELKRTGSYTPHRMLEYAAEMYSQYRSHNDKDDLMQVAEALKLCIEAAKEETRKMNEDERPSSMALPRVLEYIALCNYALGNINTAYHVALKGLIEIDRAIENSIFTGIPRSSLGEKTFNDIITAVENDFPEHIDRNTDVDDFDVTILDLSILDRYINQSEANYKADIKALLEIVKKTSKSYWDAGDKLGKHDEQLQFMLMFKLFRSALMYSWEALGYGYQNALFEEDDNLMDVMMFEMDPKSRLNSLIEFLEISSPFLVLKNGERITSRLKEIFSSAVEAIDRG